MPETGGFFYGKNIKNREYVIERMAFPQNGTVRWLDPPFFLFFITHRTNSVEQFGTSTLPWREKVSYCEDVL